MTQTEMYFSPEAGPMTGRDCTPARYQLGVRALFALRLDTRRWAPRSRRHVRGSPLPARSWRGPFRPPWRSRPRRTRTPQRRRALAISSAGSRPSDEMPFAHVVSARRCLFCSGGRLLRHPLRCDRRGRRRAARTARPTISIGAGTRAGSRPSASTASRVARPPTGSPTSTPRRTTRKSCTSCSSARATFVLDGDRLDAPAGTRLRSLARRSSDLDSIRDRPEIAELLAG